MSELYDEDIVLWSERQGELLRRRAAGELVNDAELDWPNIAEEIESVGNEQRHAVESLLTNIMQHLLQIAAWPSASAAAHWRHEIDGWRVQVERRLRRALGEMQPIDIAHPLRRAEGRGEAAGAVAVGEVLDDRAGLGERLVAVAHDGRLAERMHRAQLGRREHGLLVALVGLDLVLEAELLEQPQDALRARVVQMVDDDHGFFLS